MPADTMTAGPTHAWSADQPMGLQLPSCIGALREKALAWHAGPQLGIWQLALIDAQSWMSHRDDEDWQIWRARRCAQRLRLMPLCIEAGERIVGKPLFSQPGEKDSAAIEEARASMADMPWFPGGDAGHFHPDFQELFRLGIGGLREKVTRLRGLAGAERAAFFDACGIALEGMSDYVHRVADECEGRAMIEPADAGRWRELAGICRRVAERPPATFHEAVQLMFLAQVALWFGDDKYLASPGRMDQTLRPFYESDIAAGRTTPREALELICCLFIQMNRLAHTGTAIAVLVGGRDLAGRDATCELTSLCLAARQATRLIYPTVGLAWHEGTPSALMDAAIRMLATGVGDPAFFNDEVIAQSLRDHGVSERDSYCYMNSTCVEIKVAGASHIWVAQPYFNLPQAVLEAMAADEGGTTPPAGTFDEFCERVRGRLARQIRDAAGRLDDIWRRRAAHGCFPLASCLTADCLERGLDFDRGGARYNWVENSMVGLANLVDSLVAIRRVVYEQRELTLAQFSRILQDDWRGHEALRQRVVNELPRYGNDDPAADGLAAEWAAFLIDATESCTVGPHRYVPGFFCWIQHERLGRQTGATPDGRRAGLPLADGAGPAQGRDRAGPTASVLSTTCWPHRRALGGLVHNLKFSRRLVNSPDGRSALRAVIETYLRRGGLEIQVNVVSADTLRNAQRDPETHRDLLVRVAGYTDYFVALNRNMQDEVIARTEHQGA